MKKKNDFKKLRLKRFFFRSKPEISSVRNKRYISFIFFHVLQTFFIFLSLTEVRKNYVNEVIKYNTVDTYLLRQHASRSITKPAETHLPCLKTSRLNDWKWLRLSRNGHCWKWNLFLYQHWVVNPVLNVNLSLPCLRQYIVHSFKTNRNIGNEQCFASW